MAEFTDYTAAYPQHEAGVKMRFMQEVKAIIAGKPVINGKKIRSGRTYSALIGQHPNYLGQLNESRYHVTIRTLILTKQYFPAFDVDYVLFGTPKKPE